MDNFLKREVESDDPMELLGFECDGEPGFMIDCIVEEYLLTGWSPEEVLRLFESPDYPVLNSLLALRGAEMIRAQIGRVAARCGVFRFRTIETPEVELVHITPLGPGGSRDE